MMKFKKTKLKGRVFGCLKPETITIDLGHENSMVAGNGLIEVNNEIVQINARMPNTSVWVHFDEEVNPYYVELCLES